MNRKNSKKTSSHKIIIRIGALLLALLFLFTIASQFAFFFASAEEPDTSRLAALQNQQAQLVEQQTDFEAQLAALSAEEDSLVEKCFLLDDQSQNIASQIDNTEAQLAEYDQKIEAAAADVAQAQADYDEYYQLFYDRILDIQKTGASYSVWDLIFTSKSLSDFFTTLSSYRYLAAKDNEIMENLDNLQSNLTVLQEKLEAERSAQAEQLQVLTSEQKALQKAEKEYLAALEVIQGNLDHFAAEISRLTAEREQLLDEIVEEEILIKSVEEAKEAGLLEDDEEPAEEEAPVEETPIPAALHEQEAEEDEKEEAPAPEEPAKESTSSVAPVQLSVKAPTPSVTGKQVVEYAMQFVGNPYVYGGTSLTNGADCSGFVQSVYAHFGISLPRTSATQRTAGVKVPLDELQLGDIVCFDGHVGIYVGNGQMVNALGEKYGILVSSIYRAGNPPLYGRRVL